MVAAVNDVDASRSSRDSLLVRARMLFVLLVWLALVAQAVEWLDSDSPLWPDLAVAAICLLASGAWALLLRSRPRSSPLLDALLVAALVGAGWGLGRPQAVLALLVAVVMLRALYGSRASVAAATVGVLAAYVAVITVTSGLDAVLDPGTAIVVVGAGGLVVVIRLLGETLATHGMATAWDASLAAAAEDLLTATTEAEVRAVVAHVLRRMGTEIGEDVRDLLAEPTDGAALPADLVELEAQVEGSAGPGHGPHLDRTLRRLANDAALALDRVRSEQRFRLLAESSRDGIYVLELRPAVRYHYVNPAAARLLGLSAEELYADALGAMERVHPEDRLPTPEDRFRTVIDEPLRMRLVRGEDDLVRVEVRESVLSEVDDTLVVQGTVRDVTREWEEQQVLRDAAEQQAAAAAELRALDEMKSTFLRAVSHELRTPLTAVVGAAATLRDRGAGLPLELVEQLLDAIHRQSGRLERLLEDLLDVDRLSRGTVEPDRRDHDLLALARQAVDAWTEQEGLGRPARVEGPAVVLAVDGPKVERIVDNLLRNVAKHTPDGTEVRVRVEPDGTGARIVVEDEGPGVPESLREELFEPFAQGPEAVRAPSPGTGIGLALVAKLAELHGGWASVEDAAGGGARFVVWLPGPPAPAPDGDAGEDSAASRYPGTHLRDE